MVKHSYLLPRSVPLSSNAPPTTGITDLNPNLNLHPWSIGPKRGPGRPPKTKADPQAQSINPTVGPETMLAYLGLVDGPGPVPVNVNDVPIPVPVPVSISVPAAPTAAKRGPGRPPKAKMVVSGGAIMPIVGKKRGRGRPPRPKSLGTLNLNLTGPNVQKKRGRGRPRGRPSKKKNAVAVATSSMSLMRTTATATGRPRGRPPKNAAAAAAAVGALVNVGVNAAGVLPMKRRGRPPGSTGVNKSRTGKPLGRPRKVYSYLILFLFLSFF